MKNNKVVTVAIIIGICLFLSSVALGIAFYKSKKPAQTVSVVGLAEKDFTSDLIVWNLQYAVLDMNMKQAYSLLKEQNQVVRKFLKEQGIADSEIDFKNITTLPRTDWEWDNSINRSRDVFKGYEATQKIRIQSKDVEKIEKVIRAISELYDQNINLNSDQPEYYYTKLSDLKLEMLAEASKNAHDRAETVAKNSGGKLGGLKTATTGVFQITAPNSAEDSYEWGGAFNTSSKEKHVSINMRHTYYVK